MSNVLDSIVQSVQNLYNSVLELFDFELFGKNIMNELDNIIQASIVFFIMLLMFKTIFGNSSTTKSKMIVVFVFLVLYLIIQIWVF